MEENICGIILRHVIDDMISMTLSQLFEPWMGIP
jgi:hypothetical protein